MKRIALILVYIFLGISLFAQPKVKTWLSHDTVRFASPVVLNIQVTVPKGLAVNLPKLKNVQLSKDLVVSKSQIDTATAKGNDQYTLKLTLLAFKDTVLTVPPVRLIAGNQILYSDSVKLVVLPIEKDSAKLAKIDTSQVIDIFDVTEPLPAPVTLKELWLRFRYWLLGLLIAAVLAGLIYWLYKKYKAHRQKKQIPIEKQIPPHELALMRLEKLKEKRLYQSGKFKEFYSELSEILRQYLELRYNIAALELTTSELEALLSGAKIFEQELYTGLITVLKNSDLVKFAKYKPLPTICNNDLNFAFEFVEKTKPQPEPEQPQDQLAQQPSTNQEEAQVDQNKSKQ